MEMNVDRHLIRNERERRAWTQEHLAQVAGLGLRTVQRIEAKGVASFESVRALAAVLDRSASELAAETPRRSLRSRVASLAAASLLIMFASVVTMRSVLAEDVMLDVGLSLNDERQRATLLTAEGEDAEIRLDDSFRLVILPKVRRDGSILLATRIYESDGRGYVLISDPELATADGEVAEILVSTDRGNELRVRITPSVR